MEQAFSELNRMQILSSNAQLDIRVARFIRNERAANTQIITGAVQHEDKMIIDKTLCESFNPDGLNSYMACCILKQVNISSRCSDITKNFKRTFYGIIKMILLAAGIQLVGKQAEEKAEASVVISMAGILLAIDCAYGCYKIMAESEREYKKAEAKLSATNGITNPQFKKILSRYQLQNLVGNRNRG